MKKTVLVICLVILAAAGINNRMQTTEKAFAKGIIRLHVIANSDEEYDQQLKLKVRDTILKKTREKYGDMENAENMRINLESDMEYIKKIAKQVITENGYDYDVNVVLGESYFPRKSYGNITLPEGNYNALKVEIGKAQGQNWWCVLFPPLCFVDEACVKIDSKSEIYMQNALDSNTYNMVSEGVEFKLKSYELWQNGKKFVNNMIHYLKN